MRHTSKWSKAKIKGIKLSFQRHLRFYDRTLFTLYKEQKLQIGPTYPTLLYCKLFKFSKYYLFEKNVIS
jgi:hypothetical protein